MFRALAGVFQRGQMGCSGSEWGDLGVAGALLGYSGSNWRVRGGDYLVNESSGEWIKIVVFVLLLSLIWILN